MSARRKSKRNNKKKRGRDQVNAALSNLPQPSYKPKPLSTQLGLNQFACNGPASKRRKIHSNNQTNNNNNDIFNRIKDGLDVDNIVTTQTITTEQISKLTNTIAKPFISNQNESRKKSQKRAEYARTCKNVQGLMKMIEHEEHLSIIDDDMEQSQLSNRYVDIARKFINVRNINESEFNGLIDMIQNNSVPILLLYIIYQLIVQNKYQCQNLLIHMSSILKIYQHSLVELYPLIQILSIMPINVYYQNGKDNKSHMDNIIKSLSDIFALFPNFNNNCKEIFELRGLHFQIMCDMVKLFNSLFQKFDNLIIPIFELVSRHFETLCNDLLTIDDQSCILHSEKLKLLHYNLIQQMLLNDNVKNVSLFNFNGSMCQLLESAIDQFSQNHLQSDLHQLIELFEKLLLSDIESKIKLSSQLNHVTDLNEYTINQQHLTEQKQCLYKLLSFYNKITNGKTIKILKAIKQSTYLIDIIFNLITKTENIVFNGEMHELQTNNNKSSLQNILFNNFKIIFKHQTITSPEIEIAQMSYLNSIGSLCCTNPQYFISCFAQIISNYTISESKQNTIIEKIIKNLNDMRDYMVIFEIIIFKSFSFILDKTNNSIQIIEKITKFVLSLDDKDLQQDGSWTKITENLTNYVFKNVKYFPCFTAIQLFFEAMTTKSKQHYCMYFSKIDMIEIYSKIANNKNNIKLLENFRNIIRIYGNKLDATQQRQQNTNNVNIHNRNEEESKSMEIDTPKKTREQKKEMESDEEMNQSNNNESEVCTSPVSTSNLNSNNIKDQDTKCIKIIKNQTWKDKTNEEKKKIYDRDIKRTSTKYKKYQKVKYYKPIHNVNKKFNGILQSREFREMVHKIRKYNSETVTARFMERIYLMGMCGGFVLDSNNEDETVPRKFVLFCLAVLPDTPYHSVGDVPCKAVVKAMESLTSMASKPVTNVQKMMSDSTKMKYKYKRPTTTMKSIIRKYWPHLKTDEEIKQFIKTTNTLTVKQLDKMLEDKNIEIDVTSTFQPFTEYYTYTNIPFLIKYTTSTNSWIEVVIEPLKKKQKSKPKSKQKTIKNKTDIDSNENNKNEINDINDLNNGIRALSLPMDEESVNCNNNMVNSLFSENVEQLTLSPLENKTEILGCGLFLAHGIFLAADILELHAFVSPGLDIIKQSLNPEKLELHCTFNVSNIPVINEIKNHHLFKVLLKPIVCVETVIISLKSCDASTLENILTWSIDPRTTLIGIPLDLKRADTYFGMNTSINKFKIKVPKDILTNRKKDVAQSVLIEGMLSYLYFGDIGENLIGAWSGYITSNMKKYEKYTKELF